MEDNYKYKYEDSVSYDEIIADRRKKYLNPITLLILVFGVLLMSNFLNVFDSSLKDYLIINIFVSIFGLLIVFMIILNYFNIPKSVKNNPMIEEGNFVYKFYDNYYTYNDTEKLDYDKIVNYKEDKKHIYLTYKPNKGDIYRRVDTFDKEKCGDMLISFLQKFEGRNDRETYMAEQDHLKKITPEHTNIKTAPKFEMIIRVIGGAFMLFLSIASLFNEELKGDGTLTIFTFVMGAFLIYSFVKDYNRNKKANVLKQQLDEYYNLWENKEEKNIDELASLINKPYDETLVYVNIMMNNNYYPGYYLDLKNHRIIKGKENNG